jgi:DNA polymerase-1
MPTYKQTRKKLRRPVVYKPMREHIAKAYETFLRPTLEGDDVLGILQTRGTEETVIVSIDKDMKTIPGLHFNYGREGATVVEVSEQEANYNHYQQTLTGDTTDNYPGCPGCGPVGAQKILDACWSGTAFHTDPWPSIVKAYEKKGLGEEVALMNARVARILRAEDYNFKTKEVILWNP